MKVILYGIFGNGRREVEQNLSDKFEIIGYMDSSPEVAGLRQYDFKPLYKVEDLRDLEFDYLIITSKTLASYNEIVGRLQGFVDEQKIIGYALFHRVYYPQPYELFCKVRENVKFNGYVLGMSYAFEGLDVNYIKDEIFNFAFSSNDFFHHYHLLNKLVREKNIDDLKYIVFELPYYIFNWDRSKAESFARCINCYTVLEGEEKQYHHKENSELIEKYKVFEQMFKEKKSYNNSTFHAAEYPLSKDIIWDGKDITLSKIWYLEHEDTILENRVYFQKALELLQQVNPNIKIYLVVFPQSPRFYTMYREEIEHMKNIFYTSVTPFLSDNIQVWDYFEFFEACPHYFKDSGHLNVSGRNAFTKEIDRRLQNNHPPIL